MSNVITFPGGNSAPLDALRNPSFAYVRTGPLPPENVARLELQTPDRRRSAASMHTYVFRSYDLIVGSSEADLVRDVCLAVDKAQTKLRTIREQLQRDRDHAAAREALLTSAADKLSAAIAAATTRRRSEVEQ